MPKITLALMQRLTALALPEAGSLRTAPWLHSDFEADEWTLVLLKEAMKIDWRVMLDGDLLTSKRHAKTLFTMKSWLLLQTHRCLNKKPLGAATAAQRIRRVLHIIDYLLMNEKSIGFGKYGFMALTENDLQNFFISIENEAADTESIYRWTDRLGDFLKAGALTLEKNIVDELNISRPELFDIAIPESDWTLSINREQLLLGRSYLWAEGLYHRSGKDGFLFTPDTTKISARLYPNLLSKPNTGLLFDELAVSPIDSYKRELNGIDVRTAEKEKTQKYRTSSFRREFKSLQILHRFGCEIPTDLLESIDPQSLVDPSKLKAAGRFRTLPFPVAMKALRSGVEFFYEHGEHLTMSYANIIKEAVAADTNVSNFVQNNNIVDYLESDTVKLGVAGWSIASYFDPKFHSTPILKRKYVSPDIYFPALRGNKGLIDSLRVLYGGCQSTLGLMMARRQGELIDLMAGSAMDTKFRNLIFDNRKTGASGFLQVEARPVPSVCAQMLNLLTDFQRRLVAVGGLPVLTNVFALPTITGKLVTSSSYYNFALDAFCDYSEMQTKNGARYYIRQHQLRRFFAIAFLHGAGGDADTLRWFLGQTDPEHLWNYITDAIPGEMLEYVEAYFITEKLQSSNDMADLRGLEITDKTKNFLRELIYERFGTKNYMLIDTDALAAFIAMQIEMGMVVTPYFYYGPGGKQYKILVKIMGDI